MDEAKARLSALRPLTPEQIELLRPMWAADEVRYVYATNAIEGSSLTLGETYVVLEQGITIGGKPLRDHLDAINGKKALDYVYRLVDDRTALTPRVLLDIHQIVVGDDEAAWGGRIRDDARFIRGSMYVPPSARRASEMLDEVFDDYAERRDSEHPVVLAADLHFGIVHVHPFKDGNGRTARLAMNLHLLQNGYPPLAITPSEKAEYIETLERAHLGDVELFRAFIERLELAEIERYLQALARAYGE
ncbi:MAG TPA: Fic family protein [Candidatus Elarobacter sp.]|nr:Fic family protein [Candidatus Elarobacter sp.]